jgi:hypothetical protein
MSDFGWYSGDMHVHAPLREISKLMQAEDLNVAIPLTVWRLETSQVKRDADLREYLEKADDSGVIRDKEGRWFTVVNEELETRSSALLVSRLGRDILPLKYPMAEFAKKARAHSALVDSEKATSLEFPVIVASGGCNFVGLANNHFWRSGCYLDPWGSWPDLLPHQFPKDCFGFALAGFQLYYALQNLGFPLEVSAGSAYGVHPVPMGWSRVYVHVKGSFDAENWFRALENGYSFVTTGPMILLEVNGLEPGEASRSNSFPLSVEVQLKLLSPTPLRQAEVIVNGSVHSVVLHPGQGNGHEYQARLKVSLKTSSWLAARWIEQEGDTVSLAHTATIYFGDHNRPVSASRSREYFLDRVDKLIHEVETGKSETDAGPTSIILSSEALRRQTLGYLNQALQVYRRKLRYTYSDGSSH